MMPGMNPRQMQQMMKKMGIKQDEIPATEVIIRTADTEYVIDNPQVSKVNMMGQTSFQVVGELREREKISEVPISEEDVATIVEQVGCSADDARAALKETGDLAEAIVKLSE